MPAGSEISPATSAELSAKSLGKFSRWKESHAIWKGRGKPGWKGGTWQEEEVFNDREAKLLAVLLEHLPPGDDLVIDDLPIPYLACKSRQSPRNVMRALSVLCDPAKAGVLRRRKGRVGGDRGRYEINGYEIVPERLAHWRAWKGGRPVTWDPPRRDTRSDSDTVAPGPVFAPRVAQARAAAGWPADDPEVARLVELATKLDQSAARRARTAKNLAARDALDEKRAAELEAALAELARRPAPASPPQSAAPEGAPPAPRPDADLIAVLMRGVERNHPWCLEAHENIGRRGYRLTERERATLRKIQTEENRPPPSKRGTFALQQKGGWKHRPKAEDE